MADTDMEQQIRQNAGDRMQDNIENVQGTKKWGNLENNPDGGGGADLPGSDSPEAQQAREEFPRASESEVFEAAERAKAKFAGTYEGGGGVESEADGQSAAGGQPATGNDPSAEAGAASANPDSGNEDPPDAESVAEQAEEGEGLTTGQKLAGILSSDPNMKWESKLAEKLSGGDDEKAGGA